MGSVKAKWITSASLLVLGKNANTVNTIECNYKILVMKRSSNSSFMPNTTVFPGGSVEKSDEASDWLSLYKSLGIADSKFKEITDVQGPRPFMFKKTIDHIMAREISVRIAAIRETFEELGLLICKNSQEFMKNDKFSNVYDDFDVKHWQKEVHNDSSKFLELCQFLNVAPDLWSLYEWAAWLTPAFIKSKRFETAFFLVALHNQPEIVAEKNEVQEYMWESPQNLLQQHYRSNINLPAPQQYELLKVRNITDIDQVANFAKARNKKGITLFYPILYQTSNAVVTVYPGDDYYPANPDFYESSYITDFVNMTCEEFRQLAKNVHRSYYTSSIKASKLFYNIKPWNDHLSPQSKL